MKMRLKISLIFTITLCSCYFGYSQTNEYSSDLNMRLLEAAANGDYPVVTECLKKGVDVNTQNWDGVTALMYATQLGNKSMVKLLLDKGANLNIQPLNGLTALITASQYGFSEIAEMLIADSAKVDITDSRHATALHYAGLYNNDTIVFMLLGAGANPDAYTNDKETPLALAAINGSYEAAYLLINAGAKINTQDKLGFTPLMLASQAGSLPMVELLLGNGASVNLQNNRGFSALSLAILNKHPEIVRMLIANEANIKESNSISLNAGTLAKLASDTAILNTVKRAGVKPNYFPAFKSMDGGIEFNISSGDLLSGFYITQSDIKYNFVYNFGFTFRPTPKKISFAIPDFGKYQFMERRYILNFDLTKGFNFDINKTVGVNIGGRFLYSFGKYRGTEIPINGGFNIAPQAWLFLKKNNFEARLGYHYSNYGEKELSKSHFTIGINYRFFNFNTHNINRRLKWIE